MKHECKKKNHKQNFRRKFHRKFGTYLSHFDFYFNIETFIDIVKLYSLRFNRRLKEIHILCIIKQL